MLSLIRYEIHHYIHARNNGLNDALSIGARTLTQVQAKEEVYWASFFAHASNSVGKASWKKPRCR